MQRIEQLAFKAGFCKNNIHLLSARNVVAKIQSAAWYVSIFPANTDPR